MSSFGKCWCLMYTYFPIDLFLTSIIEIILYTMTSKRKDVFCEKESPYHKLPRNPVVSFLSKYASGGGLIFSQNIWKEMCYLGNVNNTIFIISVSIEDSCPYLKEALRTHLYILKEYKMSCRQPAKRNFIVF